MTKLPLLDSTYSVLSYMCFGPSILLPFPLEIGPNYWIKSYPRSVIVAWTDGQAQITTPFLFIYWELLIYLIIFC